MKKKVSADEHLHAETETKRSVPERECSSGSRAAAPLAASAEMSEQEQRIAALEAELASRQEELDRLRDELLRKAAEFENFRKVKERESVQAGSRAIENTIREMLPLVDDLKRVLANAPHILEIASETQPYVDGVELLKRHFDKWLADKGVSEIQSVGSKLDVQFHEAISVLDVPDTEPETIVEEYQTGYMLGDKVLRHARVIVAR